MSEKYNKEDFYNNAPINTRVRNSETGIFYIKTKKGWQKDDSGASRIGRWWETDTEEDEFYSGTIGKDGRFYLGKGRGFTITNDHPLAEKFRADEQGRVTDRKELAIKKQGDLYEKWNKVFTPIIAKKIKEFNKLYPNNPLTRDIVNEYYAAENKLEFVKNHPVLQHYSHVHLPYDQKGRYKFGPTAGIFSSIIHDLDKVEKFKKEELKLQKKYNIVPENNEKDEIPAFKSKSFFSKINVNEIKDPSNQVIAEQLNKQMVNTEKNILQRKPIVLGTELK